MTITAMYEVSEKYANCQKCSLGALRDKNQQKMCFGSGNMDAVGLLIIPSPVYNGAPAAYGADTEEAKVLQGIFNSLKIDKDLWFITTVLACKEDTEKPFGEAEIDACLPRLCDTLYSISPKIVVLAGRVSLETFYRGMETKDIRFGWVTQYPTEFEVYRTPDISAYLRLKKDNDQYTSQIANQMFKDWQEIQRRTLEIIT